MSETGDGSDAGSEGRSSIETAHRFRRMLESLIGVPATEHNEVTVLRNGDRIFEAMLGALRSSHHTIDFLTFVYWSGDIAVEFAEALGAAAKRGVRVRVLLDAVGARLLDDDLVEMMTDAGCDVRWFRPVESGELGEVNHRTHRKILVCDEEVSFTGGVGIADEWTGDARNEDEWRDTHFMVKGPATDGLRAAFVDNWAETEGDVFDGADRFPTQPRHGSSTVQVVRGAAETGWSDLSTLFRVLVQLAESRLRIASAYFNPDDHLLDLLCQAADRGVAVEILLPGPHADKRLVQIASEATYQTLLDHGIDTWCFQPSMMHVKLVTVDGAVAAVGSANVNNRSMLFDEEVDLVVLDPRVVEILDGHFDEDLQRSERIDPAEWRDRSPLRKVAEKAMSVVDDLL